MSVLGSLWGGQAGFVEQVNNPPGFVVNVLTAPSSITLSWTAQANAIFYRVYCGLSQHDLYLHADSLTALTYTINNLISGNQYYVQVTAVSTLLVSEASAAGPVPLLPAGLVFYGFAPNTSPTAAQVQALASTTSMGFAGAYDLTQSAGPAYPCFAFPVSYGTPNQFSFSGIPYGMTTSTVVIGTTTYNVYISPFATYATSLIWTVT